MASGAEDGQSEGMPEIFSIGTKTAYARKYQYDYKRETIDGKTVYVCKRGSDFSKDDEMLVLCQDAEGWTAYDSSLNGNGDTLITRQKVFRSDDQFIYKEGTHVWEMNKKVSTNDTVDDPEWYGRLECITSYAKN